MRNVLEVRDLSVAYGGRGGLGVPVLSSVSFDVAAGEVLSIVGESGAGKTTLVNALLRLVPAQGGSVRLDGVDLLNAPRGTLRRARRDVQMVFQNPFASLNPRLRVLDAVAEPLRAHGRHSSRELRRLVLVALDGVGLGEEHLHRHPHQLSGGQAQRVAIARALVLEPKLLVLDEPTAALDVSVQAHLLNLLLELRDRRELTYLFISHDLAVVRHVSDRVAVMRRGEVVEMGEATRVFASPEHPYTRSLLEATPMLQGTGLNRTGFGRGSPLTREERMGHAF